MKRLRSIFIAFFVTLVIVPVNITYAKQISAATTHACEEVIQQLEQFHKIQVQAGIQDAELSYAMKKALMLANFLFDSTGDLKIDLASAAKTYFVPSQPLEYEQHIGQVLDQFNSSWQDFFRGIKKPSKTNSDGSDNVADLALRALFSLSSKDVVTDRHAKVAVLAALLAPMNQGPVGDCFAVSDLIRDHNQYFQRSMQDYAEIVQQGFLQRLVNGKEDSFFFLPTIADSDSSRSLTVDSSGNIVGANLSLTQAPGFAAASQLMGGSALPNLLQSVVETLFAGNSSNDSVKVSVSDVIHAMANVIAQNNAANSNLDDLVTKGLYGFSSLTNQPILRATESAFAGMAEDRAQDSTRGNVNACVAQAMGNIWNTLGSNAKDFQTAFTDNFNDSYRLIYNLNIPLPQVSADGSSTDGGFQFYIRAKSPDLVGTRVVSPEDLKQFVLNVIQQTQSQLNGSDDIANQLINFVNNDQFLRDALWAYDSSNQQEPDPVNNYQKLSRTPMQSCDGDNPYEVDDIDVGKTFDNDVQMFTPATAYDLLQWSLNLSKKVSSGLLPMNSPQHAFNFVPGISDIQAFRNSGLSVAQWIQQMLVIPGMKIVTQKIDAATQNALAKAIFDEIGNNLPDSSAYDRLVHELSQRSLTIQKYAQGLLNGINNLLGLTADQANQLSILFDTILLQVLPTNDSTMLQLSSIRFAFTNWNEGSKNIYFCAYFNPRTARVAFGNIQEDKTNLTPMDEMAWVNHLQWDVDCQPAIPILLATGS